MRRTLSVESLYLHTCLVVVACLMLSRVAPAQEKKEIPIIPTNKDWTHTGIQATPGQTYKVTVHGRFLQWRSRQNGCPNLAQCRSTPEGLPCPPGQESSYKAPRLPCFSLIGRIGSGEPFLVGNNPTISVSADVAGELQLAVNDNYYDDNSDGWTVTITWLPLPQTIDIFVGGFFDGSSEIVKRYYDAFVHDNPDTPTFHSEYFSHDGSGQKGNEYLEPYIKNLPSNAVINLVGHSYGGDTAVEAAGACGRRINILITIDPVGGKRVSVYPQAGRKDPPNPAWPRNLPKKFKSARTHVTTWIDVDAQPTTWDRSDYIADWGGKWDKMPDSPKKYDDTFIPAAGLHHGDFTEMMQYPDASGKRAQDRLLGN
jgi:pimeloyl-ACP methyl ester carboxylesterase